jgi:hypothetical protein
VRVPCNHVYQRIVIKIEWTISDIIDEKHGTFQKAFNSVEKEGELRKSVKWPLEKADSVVLMTISSILL